MEGTLYIQSELEVISADRSLNCLVLRLVNYWENSSPGSDLGLGLNLQKQHSRELNKQNSMKVRGKKYEPISVSC